MINIANSSQSIEGIQRDLIKEHTGEMKEFLNSGNFTFFPEVILCVDLAANKADKLAIDILYETIRYRKPLRRKKIGNFNISISNNRKNINYCDIVQSIYIDFEEDNIIKFLKIDGNHRLSAVSENDKFKNYNIPFCLLLFREKDETDKFCRALFHNINTKQVPLKTEENLKVIIESEQLFSDEVLENDNSFGKEYLYTRKLCKSIDLTLFPQVNKFISKNKYTYFIELFNYLLNNQKDLKDKDLVSIVRENITEINSSIRESLLTNITDNISILAVMTFYKLNNEKEKYEAFISCINKNNIGDIKNLRIKDLINIYNSIYERIPKKVFLARWYPQETDKAYKDSMNRRKVIKEVVVEDLKLESTDLGTLDTATFDIRDRMYKDIRTCDIFIADLTGARHNVMLEVGYALQHVGTSRMIFYFQETDICKTVPFDINHLAYDKIEDSSDIKDKTKKRIEKILNQAKEGEI
ncbi:ParB N-terminal domain-containing protein [[Clostridium] colinum]|uniref:hypothetical protein n=1 Tax=[Clostridium] colinum TaxID=36835 RepID=UPI0020258095|nr:hypothetical protein [[Clostridium] colinum]